MDIMPQSYVQDIPKENQLSATKQLTSDAVVHTPLSQKEVHKVRLIISTKPVGSIPSQQPQQPQPQQQELLKNQIYNKQEQQQQSLYVPENKNNNTDIQEGKTPKARNSVEQKLMKCLVYGKSRDKSLVIKQQVQTQRLKKQMLAMATAGADAALALQAQQSIDNANPADIVDDTVQAARNLNETPHLLTLESPLPQGAAKFVVTTGQYQFIDNTLSPLYRERYGGNLAPENNSNRNDTEMRSNCMQSTRLSFPPVEAHDKNNFINIEQRGGVNFSQPKPDIVAPESKSSGKQMSDANVCVSEQEFSVDVVDEIGSQVKTANLSSKMQIGLMSPTAQSGSQEMFQKDGGIQMIQSRPLVMQSTQAMNANPMSVERTGNRDLSLKTIEDSVKEKQYEFYATAQKVKKNPEYQTSATLLIKDQVNFKVIQTPSTAQVPYVSLIQTQSPRLLTPEKAKEILIKKKELVHQSPKPVLIIQEITTQESSQQQAVIRGINTETSPKTNNNFNGQLISDFLTSHKKSFYKFDARAAHSFKNGPTTPNRRFSQQRQQKLLSQKSPNSAVMNSRRIAMLMEQNSQHRHPQQRPNTNDNNRQVLRNSLISENTNRVSSPAPINGGAVVKNYKKLLHSVNNNNTDAECSFISATQIQAGNSKEMYQQPQLANNDDSQCQIIMSNEELSQADKNNRHQYTLNGPMFRSSFETATRKSSLISSLVLNKQQIDAEGTQVGLATSTDTNNHHLLSTSSKNVKRQEASRNSKSRHFYRTTHLTASLQEEQIQLQKMLNPWSQVIGGQSQRYFKQRQHMQCRNSEQQKPLSISATPSQAYYQKYRQNQHKSLSISKNGNTGANGGNQDISTAVVLIRRPESPVQQQQYSANSMNQQRTRVQTAPQSKSPPNGGGFYLSSQQQRRRATQHIVREITSEVQNNEQIWGEKQQKQYVKQESECGGGFRLGPSTQLQYKLLNGISASRRSQQAQQTHVRYSTAIDQTHHQKHGEFRQKDHKNADEFEKSLNYPGQKKQFHHKRLQSQVQKRRMQNIFNQNGDETKVNANVNCRSSQDSGFFPVNKRRPQTNDDACGGMRPRGRIQYKMYQSGIHEFKASNNQDDFRAIANENSTRLDARSNKSPSTANFKSKETLSRADNLNDAQLRARSQANMSSNSEIKKMHQIRSGEMIISAKNVKEKEGRTINSSTLKQKFRQNNQDVGAIAGGRKRLGGTGHTQHERSQSELQGAARQVTEHLDSRKMEGFFKDVAELEQITQQDDNSADLDKESINSPKIESNDYTDQKAKKSIKRGDTNDTNEIQFLAQTSDVSQVTPMQLYSAVDNNQEKLFKDETANSGGKSSGIMDDQIINISKKQQQYSISQQRRYIGPTRKSNQKSPKNDGKNSKVQAAEVEDLYCRKITSSKMTRSRSKKNQTRLAESLLHSIMIKSKKRVEAGRIILNEVILDNDGNEKVQFDSCGEQLQQIALDQPHQSPYPKKKPLPIALYTFGDSKILKVDKSPQKTITMAISPRRFEGNSYQTKLVDSATFSIQQPSEIAVVNQVNPSTSLSTSSLRSPNRRHMSASKYQLPNFQTSNLSQDQSYFRGTVVPPNLTNGEGGMKKSDGTLVKDYISDQKSRIKEINLNTPFGSHTSIQDGKSSFVGNQDLGPKYSPGSQGNSQTKGLKFYQQQHPNYNMTQTLKNNKRPGPLLQINPVGSVGLIKKKHGSQLTPAAIYEDTTHVQEFIIEDSQVGKKSNNSKDLDEEGNTLDYDNQVGLFASGAQLNSELSIDNNDKYEITNIRLGRDVEPFQP